MQEAQKNGMADIPIEVKIENDGEEEDDGDLEKQRPKDNRTLKYSDL